MEAEVAELLRASARRIVGTQRNRFVLVDTPVHVGGLDGYRRSRIRERSS